jgi:hypothetical protein
MAQYPSYPGARTVGRAETVPAFMRGVYGWMSLGLMLTAGVAWFNRRQPPGLTIMQSPVLLIGLVIAQFGLVIALSAAIHKLSAPRPASCSQLQRAYRAHPVVHLLRVQRGQHLPGLRGHGGHVRRHQRIWQVTKRDLTAWAASCSWASSASSSPRW